MYECRERGHDDRESEEAKSAGGQGQVSGDAKSGQSDCCNEGEGGSPWLLQAKEVDRDQKPSCHGRAEEGGQQHAPV